MLQFVLFAMAAGAAANCSASVNNSAGQQFPARAMPPDLVAPAQTQTNAPKPDLPQSDQTSKTPSPAAQRNPVTQAPGPTPTAPASANPTHKLASRKQISKPSPVPEPVTPAPTPPPLPPTPEQMPPSPPQVNYSGGMLTVSAKNSTLLDVLNAIQARTGAKMSLPPGLTDRLFAQVGPAPPQDVLAKLLSGTNFDYVIVGSPQDPQTLQQVIVTARQGGGTTMAQSPPPSSSYPSQSRLPGMGAPAEQPEAEAEPARSQPSVFAPAQAPGGPGPFRPNPAQAPPNVANPTPFPQTPGPTGTSPVMPPNQPPQQPPQGSQPKTPEQLLQELKQMQQQQQKPPR